MSIWKRKRKNGFVYEVRVCSITGQGKYRNFKSESLAKKYERELLNQKDLDSGRSLSLGKTKVNDFFHHVWLPMQVHLLSQSSQDIYKSHYKLHIQPIVGEKKLSDIKASDGDILIAKLRQQGKNAKGVNLIVRTFRTMLNFAVQRSYIVKNPLVSVKELKVIKKADSFWQADEARQFLEGIKEHYSHPLFVTALNTGMRRGELASLKWKNVDLARRQILVAGTRGRYGDRDVTKGGSDRVVPMNKRLVELLSRLSVNRQSEYVFVRDDGSPINPHHLYRLMNLLRVKVGIANKIRFHDLRHTFASHFMMNRGNITQLSLILGHSDFKTTKRYLHFTPEYLDDACEVVSF